MGPVFGDDDGERTREEEVIPEIYGLCMSTRDIPKLNEVTER